MHILSSQSLSLSNSRFWKGHRKTREKSLRILWNREGSESKYERAPNSDMNGELDGRRLLESSSGNDAD
jgi:hypothetical protein